MMNYKEKYEIALERARALHDEAIAKGYALDYVKDYEAIFPELAESEDERIRKALVCHLKADVDFVSSGVTKAECLAYLEKQKEQKPAEWSEEDEKILEQVIDVVYDYCPDPVAKYKLKDWLTQRLKNLRPHPKQEWTEEDEKIIERLITRLNWITYNTRTDGTSPNITFFDEIAWLKDRLNPLRSQPKWKPSKEQMEVLNEAVETFAGYNDYPAIKSLYEDLQKLKEEE